MSQENKHQKGLRPFYLFPFMYVASVYLIPIYFWLGANNGYLFFLFLLPLIFGVINIVVSVLFYKPENRIMLLNAAVFVKYAMMIFFVVGGIALTFVFLLSFIPVPIPFMLFTIPATLIGSVAGWLILALEAPYVISYLCLSCKAGVRPKFAVVIHGILQFFFVADVIDVIVLTLREGKWKKVTWTIVALVVLSVIALFAFVIAAFLGSLS